MVEIESRLFNELMRGKLRHPTSRSFDRAAWINAAKALPDPSERDRRLLIAAVHYGDEIAGLRATFEENLFKGLDRRTAILISVAMANYNYRVLTDKVWEKARESVRDGVVSMGFSGRQEITGGAPGNEASPDTAVATIVDTLPHCLERADKLPIESVVSSPNYWEIGSRLYAIFSVEHSLRDLWQRVLWDGWKILGDGKTWRQSPGDRHLATLWEVWVWRHEMILSQGAHLDAMVDTMTSRDRGLVEPFVSPTVVGIGGHSRDTRSFRFGAVSGRERGQAWHRSEQAILDDSYLAQFLDAPLPRLGNLITCRELQRAWCVIRDCGQVLETKAKTRKFESVDALEALALLIRRNEVERALVKCTDMDAGRAKSVVDFFTCDLNDLTKLFTRGFWAAPMLPIDDENIAIVFPALRIGSAVRRIESWLDSGGLSDHLSNSRRGLKYEAWVRSEIANGLAKNTLLPDSRCAPNAVSRSSQDGEQIDLLIVLGNILIVGEVKCFLYPIEASEHNNYLKKLDDAGAQALRKSKWIVDNPGEIIKALQIPVERVGTLRAVPIIVTNHGAGFGLSYNGARVIDFHFLHLYLLKHEYMAGMAFQVDAKSAVQHYEKLYSSEKEAAEKFEQTMENPVALRRYINAAVWKDNKFPMSNGESMIVETCILGEGFVEDAHRMASILRIRDRAN
jgi:hypothetical protein